MRFWGIRTIAWALCLSAIAAVTAGQSPADRDAIPPQRRTQLVKLVEKCSPSVVNITALAPIEKHPGSFTLSWGSGSIIHKAGYIVTNEHVAKAGGKQQASLDTGKQFDYRIIATLPGEDLAIIKADPAGEKLTPIKLGRSHDLMRGEPILVIGNPGGLTHTVSTGIISGLNRVSGSGHLVLSGMIQTNANVNGGNSGGPLINALGEQIGIIEAKKTDGEGLGFAIQVDRLRQMLPEMISAEMRYGWRLGMEVDPMGVPKVTKVAASSPAAKAGVQVGDIITQVADMPITDGVHFYLALVERQPGATLPILLERSGQPQSVSVKLEPIKPVPPVQVADDAVRGLTCSSYSGKWTALPDFETLKPTSTNIVEKFAITVKGGVPFGLKFVGYIEAPKDGLFTFYTTSDDGSRLYIGKQLVVDNDGTHGVREAQGMIRLAAGKHPITVTYFEQGGDKALTVHYEGPGIAKQEIPDSALFSKPLAVSTQPAQTQPAPTP